MVLKVKSTVPKSPIDPTSTRSNNIEQSFTLLIVSSDVIMKDEN